MPGVIVAIIIDAIAAFIRIRVNGGVCIVAVGVVGHFEAQELLPAAAGVSHRCDGLATGAAIASIIVREVAKRFA